MGKLPLLLLVALYATISLVHGQLNPEVRRTQVSIYRKPSIVPIKVVHCNYNDHHIHYSDVTQNCLEAVQTGIYRDKWNELNDASTLGHFKIEEYDANADLLTNQVFLRSGTVCRYDRGFCYDPKEDNDFAVVWEVADRSVESCPERLDQVFYGYVDIWTYDEVGTKYLVYYQEETDRAFSLKLGDQVTCHDKPVWYTDSGFIVSKWRLINNLEPTLKLNETYFSLQPRNVVAEAILRDCDIQNYPLDFDSTITEEHLADLQNLRTILKTYQQHILENRDNISELQTSIDNMILVYISLANTEVLQNLTRLDKQVQETEEKLKDWIEELKLKQYNIDYKMLESRIADTVEKIDLQEAFPILKLLNLSSNIVELLNDEEKLEQWMINKFDALISKDWKENISRVEDIAFQAVEKLIRLTYDTSKMFRTINMKISNVMKQSNRYEAETSLKIADFEKKANKKITEVEVNCEQTMRKVDENSEKLRRYEKVIDALQKKLKRLEMDQFSGPIIDLN